MVAIIGILAAIALPNYRVAIIQAREAVLKENLFQLRDMIDQYYIDKGQYPPTLETLVEAGYLRKLPKDPITQSPDWVEVFSEPDPDRPGEPPGSSTSTVPPSSCRSRARPTASGDHDDGEQDETTPPGPGAGGGAPRRPPGQRLRGQAGPTGRGRTPPPRATGTSRWPATRWPSRRTRGTSATRSPSRARGSRRAATTTTKAREALAAKDLDKAAEELEIASNYDPSNRSAADDLALVREQIRERFEEQQRLDDYDQMKAQAAARRVPLPVLSPRSPVPITLKFQDASLQKIFDSLARIAGVNILFDEGFRDKKYSVNLSGVTFEEALEQLTFVNRLFYKVLDQNTIIVVPESRQKRVAYDDLVLRTFYLQNAEVNDTVNLIKTLAKITTAAGNPSLRAITVMGTVDQVAMAERIIELNDKARGEVIVEVKILEVNKTNMREWGLDLSNYSAGVTLSPTGAEGELTDDGFTRIRAHLLSSLNKADWVVSLPSTIFARFLADRLDGAPPLGAAPAGGGGQEGRAQDRHRGADPGHDLRGRLQRRRQHLRPRHQLPVPQRGREPGDHPRGQRQRGHHPGGGGGVQPPRRGPGGERRRENPRPRRRS